MYKIIKNENIANNTFLLEVNAPLIKDKYKPGEFVIIMSNKESERIPLTIYDINNEVVKIIYQVVGSSTFELSQNKDSLYAILGPLGSPGLFLDNLDKKIVFVAGGIGVAAIYPQIKYLKENGYKTSLIYGAKNKESLILLNELNVICDQLYICTDDGSYSNKGFVTDILKNHIDDYDLCVAIGPVKMMESVVNISNIDVIVSLNPIMVDGTGMCGACRVNIDGNIKFACVDGPEFYGKKVDFKSLINRMNIYKTEEGKKYLEIIEGNTHHGGCGNCD